MVALRRVVLHDEKSSGRPHPRNPPTDACGLILNVVERVGHEDPVEIVDGQRLLREISTMRLDAHVVMSSRNPLQRGGVTIDGVDDAAAK